MSYQSKTAQFSGTIVLKSLGGLKWIMPQFDGVFTSIRRELGRSTCFLCQIILSLIATQHV